MRVGTKKTKNPRKPITQLSIGGMIFLGPKDVVDLGKCLKGSI